MSRTPPSPAHRLTLFLDVVAEYRSLVELLPTSPGFTLGGAARDPMDHWNRLLRAFALRKFDAPADQVALGRVVKALNESLPDDWASYELSDSQYQGAGVVYICQEGGVEGRQDREQRAPEVAWDNLYGRYLHADYDRWVRSKAQPDLMTEAATWEWITGMESRVFSVEAEVRELADRGLILLAPTVS